MHKLYTPARSVGIARLEDNIGRDVTGGRLSSTSLGGKQDLSPSSVEAAEAGADSFEQDASLSLVKSGHKSTMWVSNRCGGVVDVLSGTPSAAEASRFLLA